MVQQLNAKKTSFQIANFFKKIIMHQAEFEHTFNTKIKNTEGTFLTYNLETIDEIINIIAIDENILFKKILDPSCGFGIFILRLISNVYLKYPNQDFIYNFINNSIVFIDNNIEMIKNTKININKLYNLLFCSDYTGNFQYYKYDFTIKTMDKDSNVLNFKLNTLLTKVDYIIGNPPYVTLYGRRCKKKKEAVRDYYLKNYKQFPIGIKNGKINFVMLFIEHSLDFLKEEGKLSFIIDISFFETAYKYIRKYILDNTKIQLLTYNITDFSVASGQVILKLIKTKNNSNNIVQLINRLVNSKYFISQKDWDKKEDEWKFRINTCTTTSYIINKIITEPSKTLKELYPRKNLRTCTMLLNMENRFTSSLKNKLISNLKPYPYYCGSKSLKEKFGILHYDKIFYYNKLLQNKINNELKGKLKKEGIKNKKRIGLGEFLIYDNPKVYIRQSAFEIIASYDESKSSANNSLYVFSLRSNSSDAKHFLKFLCGYLNTSIVTFFAQKRNIIRYTKGKQPQIKISDLYKIKIPYNSTLQRRISFLTGSFYKERNNEYLEKINQLVYSYYKLSQKEIEFIEKEIVNFR